MSRDFIVTMPEVRQKPAQHNLANDRCLQPTYQYVRLNVLLLFAGAHVECLCRSESFSTLNLNAPVFNYFYLFVHRIDGHF